VTHTDTPYLSKLITFFVLCVFMFFGAQSILAVEDRVLDEDLLGQKVARSVNKICCNNELLISLINGKSSGPRIYSVSELIEFLKHWSRLGSFTCITIWLYPTYNLFQHADTWKSPVRMSLSDVRCLVFGMFCLANVVISSD
jgi:hypothetical protein